MRDDLTQNSPDALTALGWKQFWQQQVEPGEEHLTPARICAHFGGRVCLLSNEGEMELPVSLLPAEAAVGDWCLLDPQRQFRAVRRLDRNTQLSRKSAGETARVQLIAANVDTVFLVTSCNQDFSPARLERYLALVLEAEAVPVVVLTKADLCTDISPFRQQAQRLRPGLLVEQLDARDALQAQALQAWCGPGQTVALLGSSGVGKLTLANTLTGQALPTQGIRQDDDKGRHTTTTRSMHRMLAGGWLIDTPGMRELQLADCEQGLADLFEDVESLAAECRFGDCQHAGEPGCEVQAAVDAGTLPARRLASYQKLQAEQSHYASSLAERRQRGRQLGKYYKKTIRHKNQMRGD